ncbi:MAG TPA: rRNA maturation RNase YbeY [Gaiellaceae bacterium]|nr:rRNA maturation RNase YbeY [Gaiellaceae bacterium]
MTELVIEVENRSGLPQDADAVRVVARTVLEAHRITSGDLGIAFVHPDEIRKLKREHLGVDEATDVLSFPIDGAEPLEPGLPRQLGDIVLCPQVVGDEWRRPLVHGLLHLLGYDHGDEMSRLEDELA